MEDSNLGRLPPELREAIFKSAINDGKPVFQLFYPPVAASKPSKRASRSGQASTSDSKRTAGQSSSSGASASASQARKEADETFWKQTIFIIHTCGRKANTALEFLVEQIGKGNAVLCQEIQINLGRSQPDTNFPVSLNDLFMPQNARKTCENLGLKNCYACYGDVEKKEGRVTLSAEADKADDSDNSRSHGSSMEVLRSEFPWALGLDPAAEAYKKSGQE